MSGTEMQRAKESAAEIMRAKQAAGMSLHFDVKLPCQTSASLTPNYSGGEEGR